MSKSTNKKSRCFATILYTESMAPSALDTIAGWHCKALLSPLHDQDMTAEGTPKKPHYHLMVIYDSARSESATRERFVSIGAVGCEVVHDRKAYARYLCHLDDPEKAQYRPEDVLCFAGADYALLAAPERDRLEVLGEIFDYCVDTECTYSQLLRYARRLRADWWAVLASGSASVIRDYCRESRFENAGEISKINQLDKWGTSHA